MGKISSIGDIVRHFYVSKHASVMNSCPPEHRGAASGVRSTHQNCGKTINQAIFFAIIIISLNTSLPGALVTAVANTGAPAQIANAFHSVPASSALFAAFLGYNPVGTLLQSMGPTVASSMPQHTLNILTGQSFFPNAIANPFMSALTEAFIIAAVLCFAAAIFSALRGKNNSFNGNGNRKKNEPEAKVTSSK